MARRAVLGGGSLNPFGGTGVDFGAFDIGGTNRESNLILTRVEVAYNAGQATDDEMLAALKAYATTLDPNTSERLNADARVSDMTYRIERNVLVAQVDGGQKTNADLLAYDKGKLAGLNHDSQEYRDRQNTYQSTQGAYYQELEKAVVQNYNDGKMTTAQLNAWYTARRQDPQFVDNKDITDAIDTRVHELGTRLIGERDTKAIDDYSKGKMGPAAFVAYATSARARYAPNTNDYNDWTTRLNDAHDKSVETALLYRYDLSQQYAQLAKFVASSKAPAGGSAGGTSTSKSTRTVLGADGKWHTVTTTSTHATPGHGPSAAEVAAYKQRQIEVNDAKKQMAQISAKVAGVGGFTSTDSVMSYYTKQLTKFAKGSDEWYQVQGKLDQLNDRKHAETVLASQGIRISYPKSPASGGGGVAAPKAPSYSGGGSSSPAAVARASDTANVNIDDFMRAIAHVESGGRYTAVNKSSGATGKYQIMPANWPGWAKKYLGNANAPMTPANQEAVAKGKFTDLYKWLGDWRAVAHWWLTGGSNKDNHLNPANWSSSSTRYVNNVMAGLGRGPVSGSSLASNAKAAGATTYKAAGAGSATIYKANAAGAIVGVKAGKQLAAPPKDTGGPLQVIVGETHGGKGSGVMPITQHTNFPTNLDGEAFTKFYAQYEQAFKSGATEFSVGNTHYWIGDNALDRRDGMRKLDELRISLYGERASAYAGTPTEITAANQRDNAVEDAARHEIQILDTTDQKGTYTTGTPIGSGIALLDKTVAAITADISQADAAMKRGDLTTAYSLYQMAADLRAGKDELLQRYSATAQADLHAIEKAYGVGRDEAMGAGGAAQLKADLDRLNNAGAELEKTLSTGSESLNTLQQVIKKDSNGNPIFDAAGPGGQLTLADNWHYELQGNGDVKPIQTPATGYDPNTGKQTHDTTGMVHIDYLSGSTTISAFAKYTIGTVGYITTADGTRVPLMGKTFTRRRPDGTDELWVEDPLHPGKWSSSLIAYKAPASFNAKSVDPNGNTVLQFNGLTDSGRGNGAMTEDGYTYSLQFDKNTGTYVMFRSKPGGLFSPEVKDEPLGSLSDGSQSLDALTKAGFNRDTTGLTSDQQLLSNLGSPFVGGDAGQFKTWLTNQQVLRAEDLRGYEPSSRATGFAAPAPAPIMDTRPYQGPMGQHGIDLTAAALQAAAAKAAVSPQDLSTRRGYDQPPMLKALAPLPNVSTAPSRAQPLTAAQRAGEQNRLAASLAAATAKGKATAAAAAAATAAKQKPANLRKTTARRKPPAAPAPIYGGDKWGNQ